MGDVVQTSPITAALCCSLRPAAAGNVLPAVFRRLGVLQLSEPLAAAVDAGAARAADQEGLGALAGGWVPTFACRLAAAARV